MGTKDGSIIAAIITTHMPRKDAAAPGQVCPGIRIQVIDIVQPPDIGILAIADMDEHQTIVTPTLAAKISADTPKKARSEARPETLRREISPRPIAPTTSTMGSALVILVLPASHSSGVPVIVVLTWCGRFFSRIGRDSAARPWAILIQLHHGPWALNRDSCKRDSVGRYPENMPNKCGRCRLRSPDKRHSRPASPACRSYV